MTGTAKPKIVPFRIFATETLFMIAAAASVTALVAYEWRENKKVANTQHPAFHDYSNAKGMLTWIAVRDGACFAIGDCSG
ncbi:hypothetical protein BC830DRAFT_1167243 [Chytriomyces sp. MP71]|nr:hypothetical protein BC830DRAFT_1167243 [Chytriomyces sp. MP71]